MNKEKNNKVFVKVVKDEKLSLAIGLFSLFGLVYQVLGLQGLVNYQAFSLYAEGMISCFFFLVFVIAMGVYFIDRKVYYKEVKQ